MTDTTPRLDLPAGIWDMDPDATEITVTAKKLGIITVPAAFELTTGRIEVSPDRAVTGVDAQVDAGSYRSGNDKRNDHIVGEDFLDAAAHPTLAFSATSSSPSAVGHTVEGTLTVKGRAVPLSFEVTDVAVEGERATFVATGRIDRNAAGVTKLPSLVIGSSVALRIDASARLQGGAA